MKTRSTAKRVLPALAVLANVAVMALPATPAQAQDAAVGALAFSGNASLPVFPCEPPEAGSLPCQGTWQGKFTGGFSGSHVNEAGMRIPWAVELDAPGSAQFAYADTVEAGVGCAESVAQGRLTLSGGLNQAFGAYNNSSFVPAPIVGARITVDFDWTRQGAAGALLATDLRIDLNVYSVGWVNVVDESRSIAVTDAVASFVPEESPDCLADVPGSLRGVMQGKLSSIAVRAG